MKRPTITGGHWSRPEPEPAPVSPPPPPPSAWYFLGSDGQRRGPSDADAVQKLIDRGALNAHSMVWTASFGSEWKPVHQAGFRSTMVPPPPPGPSGPIAVTVPAVATFWRVVGYTLAAVIFLVIAVLIMDSMRTTQSYARSIGLSISDCEAAFRQFGQNPWEARKKCNEEVPKK